MKIWQCKIGESVSVPNGADAPMREAVARAYKGLTGEEPTFIFSGWGAELTEPERAVVENRLPAQPAASTEPPKRPYGTATMSEYGIIPECDAVPVAAQKQPVVTDEMVTRFLAWKLPEDFAPDAGISFNPSPDPHSWPVGTNLLTDPQARAMLEHVLKGAPVAAQAQPSAQDREDAERYRWSISTEENADSLKSAVITYTGDRVMINRRIDERRTGK